MEAKANFTNPERHNIRLSKALSWLLRHHLDLTYEHLENKEVEDAKDSGFVNCSAILCLPKFQGYTINDITTVCELNSKQRFCLRSHPNKENTLQIRANQGHSIATVNPGLRKIEDPSEIPQVIHGTFHRFWPGIIALGGLNRMNRTHIHFTRCLPHEKDNQVISGMRKDCNVFIYIDSERAMAAGYEFFESSNGVILCSGDDKGTLSTAYFKKVIPRNLIKDISSTKDKTENGN